MEGSYYDYVHDFPFVSEPLCRTPGIGLIYTGDDDSNSCPTHLGGGGGGGQTPSGLVAGIQSAHTIEQQLKAAYDGYANNGTGPQLRSIVQNASKTSIEVRNALMDAAPRVTDDILLMTLKRQPALEGWHMAQAMLANSPLRAGVMTELAKTDYYPFFKALVQAGQTGGLTTRQIMEMDYAHYLTAQHRDLDELLQLQFDLEEEEENWTEVEQQLLTLDYLLSDKDKALMEVAKGDFIAAQNALGTCKTEEPDYCDVISSTLETQTNGMSSEGLPTNVVADLQAVSAIPDHKMKGTAEQLLAFWNEGTYIELLELPEGPGLRAARIPALEEVEIKMLGVNPNPANSTIYINYLLPDGWEEASITVYDNTGKIVAQFNASQFNGIIEMNGKEMSAGIYTVELIADKIKISTTKLTVVH